MFSGVGSAVVSDSSEAGPSLTLSWGARAEKSPDTLKLMSEDRRSRSQIQSLHQPVQGRGHGATRAEAAPPGKRVSAFCIRASTTPTTWIEDTEAASSWAWSLAQKGTQSESLPLQSFCPLPETGGSSHRGLQFCVPTVPTQPLSPHADEILCCLEPGQ